jgi:hypothetical protein
MFLGISSKPIKRRIRKLMEQWNPSPIPPGSIQPAALQPVDDALYAREVLPERPQFAFPGSSPLAKFQLTSCLARTGHMDSEAFQYWAKCLHEPLRYHRKLWEFSFICQALYERGFLRRGARGLGFAVGLEPLPSFFASLSCEILASDLPTGDPRVDDWCNTAQWAPCLEKLNELKLCPDAEFSERVSFRGIDMNAIPRDVRGFDFTWSSCSFEHCGNIDLGKQFIWNQMDCLKPGGVAVHTTEFNLTSNTDTLTAGPTVIFRRRDVEEMAQQLMDAGHSVEPLDLTLGEHELDRHVDEEPFNTKRHMRLRLGRWASTSIGLIIRKKT